MTRVDVSAETVLLVAPGDVLPNPLNPRKDLGENTEAFRDLLASVRAKGQILVPGIAFRRPRGDGQLGDETVLIMGHRRRRVAEIAGVPLPLIIRDEPSEEDQLMLMLDENLHREGLSLMEEAEAYLQLQEWGVSQDAIAATCGRSKAHVSKRLNIVTKLPERVLGLVASKGLSFGAAYTLSRVADFDLDAVERLTQATALDEKVMIRDAERLIEKHESAKRRTRVADDLRKQGVRVLSRGQVENRTAHVLVDQDGITWSQSLGEKDPHTATFIALTVEDHDGESCHAAVVNEAAQVVWVCDDPASHPGVGAKQTWSIAYSAPPSKADLTPRTVDDEDEDEGDFDADGRVVPPKAELSPEEAAERAERQERYEAAKARAIDRRRFLEGVVGSGDVMVALVCTLFAGAHASNDADLWPDGRLVQQLLGVEIPSGYDERLAFWRAQLDTNPVAAGVAASIAAFEQYLYRFETDPERESIAPSVDRFGADLDCVPATLLYAYVSWLGTVGFETNDIERVEVDAALAAEAEEDE